MDGLNPAGFADLSGRRVLALPAQNSLDFLEAVFACWRDDRLFAIACDPDVLAGLGLEVETVPLSRAPAGGWGRFAHAPRLTDDPAQIVFSSGTEGRPKAILLSHRNLADVVVRLNQALPNPRGEGFRADTELNWSTRDLPRNGDSIRQHGNRIKWPKYTRTIADWTFGGGLLEVSSGKLTVQVLNDAARTSVFNCGQLVLPAGSGDHVARGGRLTFTGAQSAGLDISGDAEVVFGPSLTIPSGKTLRIDGGQCAVGWTGTGNAALTVKGVLDMRSTPIIKASRLLYRYRRGTPLKGETSGFTGILDRQVKTSSSAGGWVAEIRDLVGTPVAGENMISPDANGAYPLPLGVTVIPAVHSLAPATLPRIARFKTNGDHPSPTVNASVTLDCALRLDLTGVAAGTYALIEAGSITGTFTSQTITGVGAGLTATVNKTSTKVEVVVAAA